MPRTNGFLHRHGWFIVNPTLWIPRSTTICNGFGGNFLNSIGNVRVGFLVYPSVWVVFPVDNALNRSQMLSRIKNTGYPLESATPTNAAMLRGVDILQEASVRPGVPKIMAVFSNQYSRWGPPFGGAAAAKANNITTIAVGISNRIRNYEYLAIASNVSENVYKVHGFSKLPDFLYRLNHKICEFPQKPDMDAVTTDTLVENEKRYFELVMPKEGIKVTMKSTRGQTVVYYSFCYKTPNSALHDGIIDRTTFVPFPSEDRCMKTGVNFFITVQGLEAVNDYEIGFQEGYEPNSAINFYHGRINLVLWSLVFAMFFLRWVKKWIVNG